MTSFEIVSNLMQSDAYLKRIKMVIAWLEETYPLDELSTKYLIDRLANNTNMAAEMDTLRLDGTKYEKTLLDKIFSTGNYYLRCGKPDQAQEFFHQVKLDSHPIVLSGGVPHFDFDLYNVLNNNRLIGNQDPDSYSMLDYMQTQEYKSFNSQYYKNRSS